MEAFYAQARPSTLSVRFGGLLRVGALTKEGFYSRIAITESGSIAIRSHSRLALQTSNSL
jgi:hypothetical protein